jgi:hypothetical protein
MTSRKGRLMSFRYYDPTHRRILVLSAKLTGLQPEARPCGLLCSHPRQRLDQCPYTDAHPNELGHRIAADTILDYLVRGRLIPRVDYKPPR